MKTSILALFFLFCAVFPLRAADPTRLSVPAVEVLRQYLESPQAPTLAGLICAVPTNGMAHLKIAENQFVSLRPFSTFPVQAEGISFLMRVREITEKGVEWSVEGGDASFFLPAAFQRRCSDPVKTECIRYVEWNGIPLRIALRALADQCQRNFICSEAAAQTPVSLLLHDVTPEEVVEELCKSHALWYTGQEKEDGTIRVLSMKEFQENLASFQQEELSETFTLLYPNVTEIASILQGLYADRVVLSLGNEDLQDDEMSDLSRRFERFNTITRAANSEIMGDFSLQNAYSVSGSRRASRNGIYTLSEDGKMDRLLSRDRASLKNLQPQEAKQIDQVLHNGGTNQIAQSLDVYRKQLPAIFVTVSRRNNLLIVRTCDPRVMEDIRQLVKQIDRPTPMVLLEMKLLELTLTDDMKTVFDYSGDGSFTLNGKHPTSWVGNYPADTLEQKAMSFQILNKHFSARIQALQDRGFAKVIATPTLLTANNEVSQIFIGKEIPITRDVNSQTIVTEKNVVTTPQTEIEFERVGTQLLVTPTINADRTVMLRLLQQNSNVSSEKGKIPVLNQSTESSLISSERPGSVQYVDVDIIESRSVSGSFVAHDQMAVVIGGMIRDEVTDGQTGIPLLMDIPWLGWFFRKTVKEKRRTELLILVKPHVLSTPSESETVTPRFLRENSKNPHANPYLKGTATIPEVKDQKQWRVR